MDSAEQAAGEKQVKTLLIGPLQRRGLMRPAGQSVAQFTDMLDDIAKRLAYMSAPALMALEEQCAANPGGKTRDRFPLGPVVLKWAADIEPPADSASPLIRAVFRHQIGMDALDQGYAPELLAHIRRDRRWPVPYAIKTVREQGEVHARELARIEAALSRGEDVSAEAASFRARRRMALQRCREIAAMAAPDGVA